MADDGVKAWTIEKKRKTSRKNSEEQKTKKAGEKAKKRRFSGLTANKKALDTSICRIAIRKAGAATCGVASFTPTPTCVGGSSSAWLKAIFAMSLQRKCPTAFGRTPSSCFLKGTRRPDNRRWAKEPGRSPERQRLHAAVRASMKRDATDVNTDVLSTQSRGSPNNRPRRDHRVRYRRFVLSAR